MNMAQVPHRIEIALWEAVIPILKTSPTAANLLLSGYHSIRRYRSIPYRLQVMIWAMSGLAIGFLLGLLFSPLALGGL